jgi:C_GCAxxG_C_C family probable redox protein
LNNNQERATALFKEGYNCAQSVFAAYCEEVGMNFETALKLSSSFGGGMGRLREVCGAVSGMFMVVGMKYGYSDPKDVKAKEEHYRLIQELAKRFEEENGSIICRELLGLDHQRDIPVPEERNESYYQRRPCAELVRNAAKLLDEIMNEKSSVL